MAPTPTPKRRAAPQRVAKPRYWMRRLGVLLVLGIVGYAAVTAIAGFVGGDDGVAEGPLDTAGGSADTTGTAAADSESAAIDCTDAANADLCAELGLADGVTVEEGDATPAGDVETTDGGDATEPEQTGPPTPDNPATVYIVGDSDAGTFGPYLQTLLDGTLVTETELNYKVSSGLARPDFFNWPAELAQKIPEVDPDIVVVTFGGNDSQGLSVPEPRADGSIDFIIGDPVANEAEWSAEYQRRAGEVMDLLLENDRHVIWVGIPNDDNPDVTAKLAIQDQAVRAAAAERPDVVFVDTWERFSGRDGGWAEFVVDPRDKEGKDVRADDGFHLNQNGAEILAIDIAIEVQKELRAMGAAI